MGIEDVSLDLKELADRILVISDNEDASHSLTRLLDTRSYNWAVANNIEEASAKASSDLYDLVIACGTNQAEDAVSLIRDIKANRLLARIPLIVIHPNLEEMTKKGFTAKDEKQLLLKYPVDPAYFLVKVTTMLRLRKFKSDQTRYDAKIVDQNAQLRDLTNRFKAELKEAQEIQKSILPKELPEDKRCLLTARYLPLEAVGGDLYDIWRLNENTLGLFIGDVTGHGLSAAFVGAMTKMALAYAAKVSPNEMLAEMNEGMADLVPEGRFVAVAAAIYNLDTGQLLVARGGQPNPYIWRADKQDIEIVKVRGMAVGMIAGSRYELFETTLNPGDKFLMLTDGFTESSDMDGNMIGEQGTGKFFKQAAASLSIDKAVDYLLYLQEQFCRGRLAKDDVTIVGIERK
ncbi:MAG: SpoIIE family protein phosphatase [Deltaproteobacteria bacterium]|nr:SpoIIE family protein phosphatase [Deltaproteobacteria bacterium]